jgi:16S rRNA (uracil1498-N3)-methyltransferase
MDNEFFNYPRFLVDPGDVSEGYLYLRGDEARHALKVLRLVRGDIFVAIDGKGQEYLSEMEIASGDGALIARVLSEHRRSSEPLLNVTLAQGLPQGKKAGDVVDRATEIGVSRIIFFASEKGKPGITQKRDIGRLQRIAVSAAKQAARSIVPEVKGPISFAEVLMVASRYDLALICDPGIEGVPLSRSLRAEGRVITRILLAVGGESGFSRGEIDEAIRVGFVPFNIGPRRLRTELAGVVATALVLYQGGDMGPKGNK